MKKILFTDLDGTLLNDQKKISQGNREAIELALNEGHSVVITTGRPLASARVLAKELKLDKPGCFTISFNGGVICDTCRDEVLYETHLSYEVVRHLFDEAHKAGLHCQTYNDREILAEQESEDLTLYQSKTNLPIRIVPDVTEVLEREPGKVIVIDFRDQQKLLDFQERMRPWADNRVDSIFSCDEYLEYIPPGVSKGNAVRQLCRHLGLPLECTIAAGDAQNDISMLKAAHVAAVMCNGTEEAKTYADYITERNNNQDGLAEIIRRFVLTS